MGQRRSSAQRGRSLPADSRQRRSSAQRGRSLPADSRQRRPSVQRGRSLPADSRQRRPGNSDPGAKPDEETNGNSNPAAKPDEKPSSREDSVAKPIGNGANAHDSYVDRIKTYGALANQSYRQHEEVSLNLDKPPRLSLNAGERRRLMKRSYLHFMKTSEEVLARRRLLQML